MRSKRIYPYRLFISILLFCLSTISIWAQVETDRIDELQRRLEAFANRGTGLNETVTISLNGSVQEMVALLAESTQINVSIDQEVKGRVSNTFTKAPVKDILLYLCDAHQLDVKFTGTIIQLIPYQKPKSQQPAKSLDIKYNDGTKLFTLNLQSDTLSQIIKVLSEASQQNIAVDPTIRFNPISGFINNAPLETVVDQLALNNNLQVEKKDNFYFLREKEKEEKVAGNARSDRKDKKKEEEEVKNLIVKKVGNNKVSVYAVDMPILDIIQATAEQLGTNYYLMPNHFPELQNQQSGVGNRNRNNQRNNNSSSNTNSNSNRNLNTRSNFSGNGNDNTASLQLKSATFKEVMEQLSKNSDYSFTEDAGIFIIGKRTAEGLRETKVIQLQYRAANGIVDVIPSEMLVGVEVDTMFELNSLILSGSETNINEIAKFIEAVDKLVPMIMIELIIVDVQDNISREVGIEAGATKGGRETGGSVISSTQDRGGIDFTFSPGAINSVLRMLSNSNFINLGQVSSDFYLSLKAVEEKGFIEIKSTPKLSTLNSHDANLSIGQKRYYLEQQVNFPGTQDPIPVQSNTYKEVEANLDIDIRPFVSGDEQVTLEIFFEQSEFITEVAPNEPPPQVTRQFESMIRMKNGEMVVLGGLERETKSKTKRGVPFLSRIPVLGWLFGKKRKSKTKEKLLIFVRPTIIN